MVTGYRDYTSYSDKKCGHSFSNDYFLVNHKHNQDRDGETYIYCTKCNTLVSLSDSAYQ